MTDDDDKHANSDDAIVLKGIQTLFGDVQGRRIVFCIDTSGSTFEILPIIKEHLTETLVRMAYQTNDYFFNLIKFNSHVCQWSDNLVPCTPETVNVAVKWIREFESTSGTNTLDALLCAFENDCDSVYLVTDSCPDQDTDSICDHISYIGKGRPLNCIYVSKETPDKAVWEFLEELSSMTHGSFNVVSFSRHGIMDRVTPIHTGSYQPQVIRTKEGSVYPNLSNCSITSCLNGDPLEDPVFVAPNYVLSATTGQPVPYYHPHNHWFWWGAPVPGAYGPYIYNPFYSWSRYKASRAFIKGKDKLRDTKDDSNLCPSASALLIGRRVLARSSDTGFYYSGKVKSETYGRRFLIQFSEIKGKTSDNTFFQDTSLADIVAFDDAFRHPILPGDRVLVPENVDNPTKYLLATVMEGSETRSDTENAGSSKITVSFTSGKMETIPAGLAVWIPNSMYHRVSLEEKMPKEARKKLRETPGYPLISLPGYPTKEDERTPQEYERTLPTYSRGIDLQVDHMLPPYYLPIAPTYETYGYEGYLNENYAKDTLDRRRVRGHAMTISELEEKVDRQLKGQKVTVMNTSSDINPAERKNTNEENSQKNQSADEKQSKCEEEIVEKRGNEEKNSWENLYVSDADEMDENLHSDDRYVESETRLKRRPIFRRAKSPEIKHPPWRHFGKDTIPEMLDRKEPEPYVGVRGTACMETRPIKHIGGAVEWPDSSFGVGDPNRRTRYDREILLEDLQRKSQSKSRGQAWQSRGPLGDLTGQLGRHEIQRQQEELERVGFQRQRVLNREELHQARLRKQEALDKKAEKYRKDRNSAQIDRLRQRQLQDEEALIRQREYKRAVVENVRSKYADGPERDAEKDIKRVEMMRQRREERESAMKDLEVRVDANRRRLEDLHRQRDAVRWENVHNRLQAEEKRFSAQDLVAREAERNRRVAHRHREEANQRQLELEAYAAKQSASPLA